MIVARQRIRFVIQKVGPPVEGAQRQALVDRQWKDRAWRM